MKNPWARLIGRRGAGWRVPLALLLGALVLVLAVGRGKDAGSGKRVPYEPGLPLPAQPELFPVSETLMAPRIGVAGTMESEENIHLSSRVSAYVSEVFVAAGQVVTNGQDLVTLDNRELLEQLSSARAHFTRARSEYEREKELLAHEATTAQAYTAAEAAFQSARADLQKVEVILSYTRILSPINGIVTDRRIEVGDLAGPGQLLLTVYDPLRMRLEAPVPVRLVERLALGQDVEVTLDVPAQTFTGTVKEIVSAIDPLSRTQTVKVGLDQGAHRILPGTFGRLWVSEKPRPALLVPSTAVYEVGQLAMVQVVRDSRVLRRLVQKGRQVNGQVEILAGLNPGDTILATPVRAAE